MRPRGLVIYAHSPRFLKRRDQVLSQIESARALRLVTPKPGVTHETLRTVIAGALAGFLEARAEFRPFRARRTSRDVQALRKEAKRVHDDDHLLAGLPGFVAALDLFEKAGGAERQAALARESIILALTGTLRLLARIRPQSVLFDAYLPMILQAVRMSESTPAALAHIPNAVGTSELTPEALKHIVKRAGSPRVADLFGALCLLPHAGLGEHVALAMYPAKLRDIDAPSVRVVLREHLDALDPKIRQGIADGLGSEIQFDKRWRCHALTAVVRVVTVPRLSSARPVCVLPIASVSFLSPQPPR